MQIISKFKISPNTFTTLTSNIKNSISNLEPSKSKTGLSNSNIIKLIPSEMDEYSLYKGYYKSYTSIQTVAESEGITNIEKKACTEACGKRNMDYNSFNCDKDLLTCYCKK